MFKKTILSLLSVRCGPVFLFYPMSLVHYPSISFLSLNFRSLSWSLLSTLKHTWLFTDISKPFPPYLYVTILPLHRLCSHISLAASISSSSHSSDHPPMVFMPRESQGNSWWDLPQHHFSNGSIHPQRWRSSDTVFFTEADDLICLSYLE